MHTLLFGRASAVREGLAEALRKREHQVHPFEEVEAAWDFFQAERTPLVLLVGADEACLALCRRIRQAPEGETAALLAVVAQDAQRLLPDVMEAGADDYVLSPLKPERLEARLTLAERRAAEKLRRKQNERELETRARQQAVVSELGLHALDGADPEEIMDRAVHAIAETLEVEFAKVMAYQPDEETLVLQTGVGWKEGWLGRSVTLAEGSQAGYTLRSAEPVVIEDLRTETRFSRSPMLAEHDVVSGLSVVIPGEAHPYGVLGTHTAVRRTFTDYDVHFLQAVANVLGAVVEQQRTEKALHESEVRTERLAMVASSTINGVIITDAERRVEWVNEGFTRITGYTLEEVRGKKPGFLLQGPETAPETVAYMREQLRQQKGFMAELLNYRKSGEPYWVRVEVQPLRDAGGTLTGYMAIETDVTERKGAEEALRESEAKTRAILETTVDAIITIDAQGHIESFNSAAERIFGYAAEEVLGQNVSVLMPDPYREEHDGYLRSYHETGRRRIIGIGREVVGRRKDGSTFPMDLAVSEVALGGRTIFTGIVRDISERRRLEQEILEISEQERRRIGQDLHDGLGQMLTGIGLISQNLARRLKTEDGVGAEEVAEITEMIKEADQQARGLARGLVPVELDANGLSTALQRLAVNARRLFGITCTYEEVGTAPLYDNTAATHLYRIAQEAASNAVKHGQAEHVLISLAHGESKTRLRIQDDGIGFPEKLPENRGMGVRIMHHRARMIGATLEIRPDPAGGTVITCTLPRTGRIPTRAQPTRTLKRSTTS